ncbi:aminotransferase class I/II-fold pyridoxal phosphate-dependent enzyme [Yoonia sp.]|uniref:aminotransferase class I/II-fold pyridoxal phosphate-dependent enzyme n=1 Tax=Yoonia sp. TaxID=2212373 RepID=UPI002391E03E|nr:aminotransferase class I/II-fold pyridoxal phosphate-dependent enzyme [Yoonia sp.]MDE0850718.1 aminotransferase class I/II-fold pyridoxal phosphate-dependent enzyme [Yoonia sp.]
MVYPERFSSLPEATWPRLRGLLDHRTPGDAVINMTIGEPQHAFPDFVGPLLTKHMGDFRKYPNNNGSVALLDAITLWLDKRYGVSVTPENVLSLNGTREGLFNAAIALGPETKNGKQPVILSPNPFYPAYSAAAASIGAEAIFVPATDATGHLPDYAGLPEDILARTTIAYICSPANPQGAVADEAYWTKLIGLAEKHDFKIFSDECYSEIYRDVPPTGALEMAHRLGCDPDRVMIFHSLSKRSNLAGLRSGFCAGGIESIRRMRQLRAYAGSPLPGPLQAVAAAAWLDEAHVIENRALYQQKYKVADQIMGDVPGYMSPAAGFFLWLPVYNGEAAAVKLWEQTGVRTLPGAYLARDFNGVNPADTFLRVAMVAPTQEMQRGLTMIRDCLYG